MTWQRQPPACNKLLRLKELVNKLAEVELQRIKQTAERMQQTVRFTKGA